MIIKDISLAHGMRKKNSQLEIKAKVMGHVQQALNIMEKARDECIVSGRIEWEIVANNEILREIERLDLLKRQVALLEFESEER